MGRFGGDEFVLLIESDPLTPGIDVVAERILDILQQPFKIAASDEPISVSASIGVAIGEHLTPEELLRNADIALYRAKDAGKRRSMLFEPSMQVAVQDRRQLDIDLRAALKLNQFFLAYQPTIDLQSNSISGVEALIRWNHPIHGVIHPDEFVPSLDRNGLILPIGTWVIETACRQAAMWQQLGYRFSVSVNVSSRQLEHDQIVQVVERALDESGMDPALLVLEITETTLMKDIDETIVRLTLLKALGVRIAIDDFGTGYSSLSYLQQFPIDILKIDQSFVAAIGSSPEALALVHTLVQLGKALKLEITAEGVENNAQRQVLESENVDSGQGFLFSMPINAVEIGHFLQDTAVTANDQLGFAFPTRTSKRKQ